MFSEESERSWRRNFQALSKNLMIIFFQDQEFCRSEREVLQSCIHRENSFYFFVFLFFYGHTLSTWKFPVQGWNRSHSCHLRCSCSNTGSLNPLCQARDGTPTSAVTGAAAGQILNRLGHHRNSWECSFYTPQLVLLSVPK